MSWVIIVFERTVLRYVKILKHTNGIYLIEFEMTVLWYDKFYTLQLGYF